MNDSHLTVATRCFSLPIRRAIVVAAEMKVSGVQFDVRTELKAAELSETGRRQLLHTLRERSLVVSSVTLPMRHALAASAYLDERLAAIKNGLTFAAALKCSRFLLKVGQLPELESQEWAILVEIMNDLVRHGNHVGVTICVTPCGEDAETLLAFLSQIHAGPIGIDFDPAERVLGGQPIDESLRVLHSFVEHVTIRDAVRELFGQGGSGQEMAVGQGVVDWNLFLALVAEIDYRGSLNVVRNEGNQQRADIERAIDAVRTFLV